MHYFTYSLSNNQIAFSDSHHPGTHIHTQTHLFWWIVIDYTSIYLEQSLLPLYTNASQKSMLHTFKHVTLILIIFQQNFYWDHVLLTYSISTELYSCIQSKSYSYFNATVICIVSKRNICFTSSIFSGH